MHTPVDAEVLAALLDQSTWVRRLAGSLVRDDALADDLTQEAWLAALRHPPDEGLPVRPWLAQVLRNLVRMNFRGEQRRKERERVTQEAQEFQESTGRRDAYLDSPEQLVARAEVRRTLTSLIVALEEPIRSTLLLRYYEGLGSADIAARQGVPAGTVRWRLKTGIDKLRVALDRSHGGDRKAWLPALAPLALDRVGADGASTIALGVKLKGVMGANAWIPMALVIAVGTTGVLIAQRRVEATARTLASETAASRVAAKPDHNQRPPRLDRAQRTQLLQRIEQAQRQSAGGGERRRTEAGGTTPHLDAEYIRAQMRTLLPMVKECYENALFTQPQLAGQLVVNFTIVAEPDIGGLVAESSIDAAASTIADEGMRECVQETMYAAQFPAPQDGGELHVTYPFDFSTAR